MKSGRKPLALLTLALLWVLFVLGGYYYYHKPISIDMIAAPVSGLIDLLFVLLFAGLAGGLGRRLLPAGEIAPLERSTLQYALGAAVLSLVWLVLGALGLYRFPLGLPLLLAGFLAVFRSALAWYRSFTVLGTEWKRSGRFERFLVSLVVVLVLIQLLTALAPPTKWDALTYHLQLPRQYLDAGYLRFVPENPYWGHPQLVEMLNTFAMSFYRAQTAAVLGWSVGVIFLAGLFGLTLSQLSSKMPGERSAPSPGWIAVTAVVAGETFRRLMAWSYTDLYSALYGLAALTAFFAWLDSRQSRWLILSGLMAGFAIGTKWTAGALFLGLALAALVLRREGNLKLRDGLIAGVVAFLATTPWLIKNLIATGSPLYPYLIGTPWFDSARLASANQPVENPVLWQHIFLPFSTTWAGVDSAPGFSADLGPLLLLFALPGLWVYRKQPRVKAAAIILIPAALAIALASLRFAHLLQTRLYFALLPAFALSCGWGWSAIQPVILSGVRLRRVASGVVALVMILVTWQDFYWTARVPPGQVLLGRVSQTAYLEQALGTYSNAMGRLKDLPDGTRVLFLWEPRGLYAPASTQADLWIDRWRTDRRELGSAPLILANWKQQGFTHALVYQQGVEIIRPLEGAAPSPDWTAWQELVDLLPAPEAIGEQYSLYALP